MLFRREPHLFDASSLIMTGHARLKIKGKFVLDNGDPAFHGLPQYYAARGDLAV